MRFELPVIYKLGNRAESTLQIIHFEGAEALFFN